MKTYKQIVAITIIAAVAFFAGVLFAGRGEWPPATTTAAPIPIVRLVFTHAQGQWGSQTFTAPPDTSLIEIEGSMDRGATWHSLARLTQ